MGSKTTLAVCVLGLYGLFLTWLILQERINTKPYGVTALGDPVYFKSPIMINIVQAALALFVGFIYLITYKKQNPLAVFFNNDKQDSLKFLKSFVLIALTTSLAGPLGYQSLKHVDYLAYLLAKLCKLIPVMVVHLLFYGTRFPMYKYFVAVTVTLGVVMFTLNHGKPSKGSNNDGNTALGLAYLAASMFLDGLTNSTQDQMFKSSAGVRTRVTGANLMCILNFFVLVLSLAYVFVFRFDEVQYFVNFCTEYPAVLRNIFEFGGLGALGQVFVFIILEQFDSLILISATVTRKMLLMILSVVFFNHSLTTGQWVGVGLVFAGIGYESWIKSRQTAAVKPKQA